MPAPTYKRDGQLLAEYPIEDYIPFTDYDQALVPNGGMEGLFRFIGEM